MSSSQTPDVTTDCVTNREPLVILLTASCIGIVVDRYMPLGMTIWCGLSITALATWFIAMARCFRRVMFVSLLLGVAAAFAAWHHLHWRLFNSDDLGLSAPEIPAPVCVEGIIVEPPRTLEPPSPNPLRTIPKKRQTRTALRVERVRDGSSWRPSSGLVRLIVDGTPLCVEAGDRVRVFGFLGAPAPPQNPGEFNFADYERMHRHLGWLHANSTESVVMLREHDGIQLQKLLGRIRRRAEASLQRYMREETAELAAAILLGIREGVARDRSDDFMATGTIHLLAISGLHVGILAYGFWLFARHGPFSRRMTLLLAIAFVFLYAMVTGGRPPVLRAGLIVTCVCTARILGRRSLGPNTLAFAGVVVISLNPSHLFQTGTQLSFLAVAALSTVSRVFDQNRTNMDPLSRLIAQSRPLAVRAFRRFCGAAWQVWLASAVIWFVTLPLVMYRFHLVTPIALLLNPILWIPTAVALFSGFGVVLFGSLVPPLARICGWVCDQCLMAIEWLIRGAISIDGNHFWVPSPPLWWVIGFYAIFSSIGAISVLRRRPSLGILPLVGWYVVGLVHATGPLQHRAGPRDEKLTCSFIAVGHGTSVLLELPSGQSVLYDGGCFGSPEAGARAISSVLWSRGITRLDAIIVSHADVDHYNAIPELLEKFGVGTLLVSPLMFKQRSPPVDLLHDSALEADIPIRLVHAGDRLEWSHVTFDILHPPPPGVPGSDNANSVVVLVTFADKTIILPGDIEAAGLDMLLETQVRACDILMAPHHGSIHSEPARFAAWSNPRWVVVSCGRGRSHSEVHDAYSRIGARALETGDAGMVQFEVTSDGIERIPWK